MTQFILLVAFIAGIMAVFFFVEFSPKYANKHQVSVFNKTVLAVVTVFCIIAFFQGQQNLPFSTLMNTMVAAFISLATEVVLLFFFLLLRNFWIFKPPKRPGDFL
ncbi:MAG: hypothetical protein GY793_02005 [Proteobacteria bacterium]|nr:hypothetical protein [Pseudomonadota bacterium]